MSGGKLSHRGVRFTVKVWGVSLDNSGAGNQSGEILMILAGLLRCCVEGLQLGEPGAVWDSIRLLLGSKANSACEVEHVKHGSCKPPGLCAMDWGICSSLLTLQDHSLLCGNLSTQVMYLSDFCGWPYFEIQLFIPHVILGRLYSPLSFTFFFFFVTGLIGSKQCLSALWMHDGGGQRGDQSLSHTG